jgi:hypothetical protein
MVTVSRIEEADEESVLQRVSADFVTVTIKDQFISRGDMHFFQKSLIGRWIYEGERISDTVQVSLLRGMVFAAYNKMEVGFVIHKVS